MDAFELGVRDGIKEAAFGAAPVAGAVKSIGGVTKKFVNGKWVAAGPGGEGLGARIAKWFTKKPAIQEPTKVLVKGVRSGGQMVRRAA